jgi:hypothetical protein
MKKGILCIIIIFCFNNYTKGQTCFQKIYWGDTLLNKSYGLSGVPPYYYDTSIVNNYHLPDSIDTKIKGSCIYALFKTEKDSLPTQIALYQNGKMSGFYIQLDNGDILRVKQKPKGIIITMYQGKIISVFNSSREGDYFDFESKEKSNYIKITIKINNIEHCYYISCSGGKIIELLIDNGIRNEFVLYNN